MSDAVKPKPALTIDDQIVLLERRGLLFKHTDEERQFLIENNYYRLNLYFHKLMDSENHFQEGISLALIKNIYETDNFVRRKIFSMLEPIEIGLKTKIAYHLGNKYGSLVFYKKENFDSPKIYDQISNTFYHEITRNQNDFVVNHHYQNYSGYFPIWVIVEYLSFNCISNLFSNLKLEDQKEISKVYYNIDVNYFRKWIHSLSVFRNICAHFSYLFQRIYTVPISFGYDAIKFPNQENRLFGIFYAIKKISPINSFIPFYTNVCRHIGKEKLIEWYNFPGNYIDLL